MNARVEVRIVRFTVLRKIEGAWVTEDFAAILDAVLVTLEAVVSNEPVEELLANSRKESFLVRLLADGMNEGAALHRLFGERLQGNTFVEADSIVWIANSEIVAENTVKIEVISSGFWLDALRDTRSYESSAHAEVTT